MWTYNKEDLVQEVNVGGNYLSESGAYEAFIKEVVFKDNASGSKQVNIKIETASGQSTTLFVTYAGKDGAPVQFLVTRLNQLCGILKVKPEDLATKSIDKQVGVFLKAKLSTDKKYINFDLDGVYDPKTKLTTKEANEKATTPEVYNKLVEKYGKETPLEKGGNSTTTTTANNNTFAKEEASVEDSFPF